MWLKWRLLRNGFTDEWQYVTIPKWTGEAILSMGENPDPDLVAERLEEDGAIQFPTFSVARWTKFEWEILEYPPPEILHTRIQYLRILIKSYEAEIIEHLELLKKIESSGG